MKIGILGTGSVGQTLADKLLSLGHEVKMGTRDVTKLADWLASSGPHASAGSYGDAAAFGEVVFNALKGFAALELLQGLDAASLKDKILVDISNPLEFRDGLPGLLVCNDDSLGEQIQRALPQTKVVKTLNTVNREIMVSPEALPGDHVLFVSGDDQAAKAQVTSILKDWLGWREVIDLGDIRTARMTEMYLPLWVLLRNQLGTARFNIALMQ